MIHIKETKAMSIIRTTLRRILARRNHRCTNLPDPARTTDAQLAATGLDRDRLIALHRCGDWNPPDWWLRHPRSGRAER
ncbi:MAG: hypothetical protein Q4G22_13655 [Paracoccus sp. (in: a-proteobacteria)]|uniref:hypothetical protein n=1 Tax=Paracoccus sp. TaxID=267 RepID=UPI0026DF9FD8|nr:hypothetical protein [Paracoccus sp. (in: a-proteobacteria)]MDO5632863.1 hypothetical protein [Paracoccus sp. (in: a-proteobacteria)]